MQKKKVVIIGGGFGGVQAARILSKHSSLAQVTLVSKQENFLYYPALYKLASREATTFSELKVHEMVPSGVTLICDEVIGIKKEFKKITFSKREDLAYDILILAMGSVTEDFGTPGVREHMCQFRTLEDIHCLRGLISSHTSSNHTEPIIVVGGGPTGVELAACIQDIFDKEISTQDDSHVHVAIIEGSPSVVSQLPEKARYKIKRRLVKMGLDVYTTTRVTSYDGHILKTNTGEFASKTVIWAAGLAAHPLLKDVGAEYDKKGRVVVNDYLETTVDENIFAIGDSASTVRSGLAQTAIHDGSFVARSIIQKIKHKNRSIYKVPNVGYAVPVGPWWGIASFGPFVISGFLGALIRDFIDFRYLLANLGFKTALKIFKGSHRRNPNS